MDGFAQSPRPSVQLDLHRIAGQLAEPGIRDRIIRDYGLVDAPSDPETFVKAWIGSLEQHARATPLSPIPTAEAIYKAVVHALASNSRTWTSFLGKRDQLWGILGASPTETTLNPSPDLHEQVRACLPGQTGRADARAILSWAKILADNPSWGQGLQAVWGAQGEAAERLGILPPEPQEQMISLALHLGACGKQTPGLGFALSAEFLRNLGFEGFKPDRHVIRLLGLWAPDVVESCRPRARELGQIVGRRARDAQEFATTALAGLALTPAGVSASRVDNLVWGLGAYVEKKGRESDHPFVVTRLA